jgi:DNA-directed RNA polymerase subunit beta'
MARLGRVIESGDSEYLVGSLVNRYISEAKNDSLVEDGKNKALVIPKLMGIKGSALHTESFLSAMSFQEQVRVLTQSAILGKVDTLRGMKENVIIGRRIPSGEEARSENLLEYDF